MGISSPRGQCEDGSFTLVCGCKDVYLYVCAHVDGSRVIKGWGEGLRTHPHQESAEGVGSVCTRATAACS